MSLLEDDYRPCQSCGTLTDSGVCSPECADTLTAAEHAKRIPLGCFRCDVCDTISAVYAYPTTCRECHSTVCRACAVGEVDEDDTGAHAPSCRYCATDSCYSAGQE
jgi:hypothetical protein